MSESSLESLIGSPDLTPPTDEGVVLALAWLADGFMAEAMPPDVALAAFAGLAQEAQRRGLVRFPNADDYAYE